MPIDAAIAFDKSRDFGKFLAAEPLGAARWLSAALQLGRATGPFAEALNSALTELPGDVSHIAEVLAKAGKALTAPPANFAPNELRSLGLVFSDSPPTPLLRGQLRLVPTTRELGFRLTFAVGQREYPLVCNDDPLESFAADLSAFAQGYEVAVAGWPDVFGQILVEEAAPVMNLRGLQWSDWAQGRLFDNGVAGSSVVLRVNSERQITIDDAATQERLRSFIGTAVVLYGKREVMNDGSIAVSGLSPDIWFLTRLTNPADPENHYPGAPRPTLFESRCLCIGATPPWNWQGPNVETHILAPQTTASLIGTEERRVVFGRPADGLPAGWQNPVGHVTRVIDASSVAETAINSSAHFATRRAPRGSIVRGLRGCAELTSAELVFNA